MIDLRRYTKLLMMIASVVVVGGLGLAPASAQTVFHKAINMNGAALSIEGKSFVTEAAAGATFLNAQRVSSQSVALIPAVADSNKATMIRSSIWGTSLSVEVPVPNSTYDVYVYNWEDSSSATFDLFLEGAQVANDVSSGAKGTWKKLGPYRAVVKDDKLTLKSSGGAFNLSGMEIYSVAAPTPTPTPTPSSQLAIEKVLLVKGGTNQILAELQDGATINLAETGTLLNIEARAATGASSVKFELDASAARVENTAPYALFGDSGGVFNSGALAVGSHQLALTGYSADNATGSAGDRKVLQLNVINNAPTPTPAPTSAPSPEPSPAPTPIVSAGYPVMPGCAQPSLSSTTRYFYVDPVNGSTSGSGSEASPWRTMQEVISAGHIGSTIRPGDVVFLRTGHHGSLSLSGKNNSAGFIFIKAEAGHKPRISGISVANSSMFVFEGLEITRTGNTWMVQSDAASHDLVFARNDMYSARDTSGWSISNWISTASYAVKPQGKCTSLIGNKVTNIRHGFSVYGSDSLIQDNEIRNFSGDGIQVVNSRITVRKNKILDSYVSVAAGDSNHDDAIQSWYYGSDALYDITVDSNLIIESTDANRPFQSAMQAIGFFNGLYVRAKFINNACIASEAWAIALLKSRDSQIVNNILFGRSDVSMKIGSSGDATSAQNLVVRNNMARSIEIRCGSCMSPDHNLITSNPSALFVKYDYSTKSYDLHHGAGGAGIGTGSSLQAPVYDIEGRKRGTPTDLGAYTYTVGQ